MIYLLLIIAHLIGDFILQSSKMAADKQNSILRLLLNGILYAVPFGIILGLSINICSVTYPFIIVTIMHFAI